MSGEQKAEAITNINLRDAVKRLRHGSDHVGARRDLVQALRGGLVLLPRRDDASGNAELVVGSTPDGQPVLLLFSGPASLREWTEGEVFFWVSKGVDALLVAKQHLAVAVVIDPRRDAPQVALSRPEIDAILEGFEVLTTTQPAPGTPLRLRPLKGVEPRQARRARTVPPALRSLLDTAMAAGELLAAFVVEEGREDRGWRLTVAVRVPEEVPEGADRQMANLGRRIAEALPDDESVDLQQIDGDAVGFYAALDLQGQHVER
jgi:hypothetical protein